MKKNIYYQPDYYLLNREAKAHKTRPSNTQAGKFIDRLLPGNNKPKPINDDPELFRELSAAITDIKNNVDWEEDLFAASYVAFDTETTGLQPFKGDEIISWGAVEIEKNRILEQPSFYQMVNPRRPVPARAQNITGLNDKILRDKPEIMPVILDFLKFCGPRILIAHNAPFDLAFINLKLGEAIGERIVNPVIDTVLLTSNLYYHLEDYSLENLSSRFDLDLEGRHNALADARISAKLFLKLLPLLRERGISTLPHLARLFADHDTSKGYPLIY